MVDVVRQSFFARFVSEQDLKNCTDFDLLTSVELARLIRLLGIREIAIACRGITASESVSSFLKRFSAEDNHAIVLHLSALSNVKPMRTELAESLAQLAVSEDPDAGSALLDRLGLSLVAVVLALEDALKFKFARQKLPIEAARQLDDLISESDAYCDRALAREIREEVVALAVSLRRSKPPVDDERRKG